MTAPLPPDLQQYVDQAISSGRYDSEEQVYRAAFDLLQRQERRRESLREDVKAGFDQFDQGEGIELDENSIGEFLGDIQNRGHQRRQAAREKS